MAAAPLKHIVDAEAIGATLIGTTLALWPHTAAARLGLASVPPSWAIVRVAGVLLLAFGLLLWSVRAHVARERSIVSALAIGHGVAGVLLVAQQLAIWTNGFGSLVALVPLGLALRYIQYARGAAWSPPAPAAATLGSGDAS